MKIEFTPDEVMLVKDAVDASIKIFEAGNEKFGFNTYARQIEKMNMLKRRIARVEQEQKNVPYTHFRLFSEFNRMYVGFNPDNGDQIFVEDAAKAEKWEVGKKTREELIRALDLQWCEETLKEVAA